MIVSPWYPVPPNGYGGIEQMAYYLARELQLRGHEVSVIGQQGSKGPFETIAIAPESWSSQLGTRDQLPRETLFLYRAYELIGKRAFDVVHDHSGLMGILMGASTRLQTPVVATIHGDLTEAEAEFLASYSAPAGHWQVDGYGFSRVADEHPVQPVAQTSGPKCWYVLDVKLCD